jgi:hypothetical protein
MGAATAGVVYFVSEKDFAGFLVGQPAAERSRQRTDQRPKKGDADCVTAGYSILISRGNAAE